jgi:uncharacterized protein YqeY
MKSGDKQAKEVLTVLLGDLESDSKRGKTVDDAYIIKTIKKSVQNATENYKHTYDNKYVREVEILVFYVPPELSEDELSSLTISMPTLLPISVRS